MSKLLSNLPVEDLTSENDYLGIIEKGDIIKNFLLQNKAEFSDIKMFALYGEWGSDHSGKSTLMKYLKNELQGICNTYFFEAWEYESDSNLPISLLEDLMDKSLSNSNKISKEILEIGEDLFFGFAKSIKLSIPGVSISGKDIIESVEKEKSLTFLQAKRKFKKNFLKWENLVLKDNSSKFNVIFIDDLDRCEPENVLNLLSALKLFFSYGKKTIFFCGVDRLAVKQAVSTKYGDIVKSEEYLEKVFDLSFRMPKKQRLDFLVKQYFPGASKYTLGGYEKTIADIVAELLYSLNFRNARRVKKVLNKYLLLNSIIESLDQKHYYRSWVPSIFNNKVVLFDLIFCLYFIILKEFNEEIFNRVANKNLRVVNYAKALKNNPNLKSDQDFKTKVASIELLFSRNGFDYSKSSFDGYSTKTVGSKKNLRAAIAINFSPIDPKYLNSNCFGGSLEFIEGFKDLEKGVDYKFTHYLLGNFDDLVLQNTQSVIGISDIYKLVDSIL